MAILFSFLSNATLKLLDQDNEASAGAWTVGTSQVGGNDTIS